MLPCAAVSAFALIGTPYMVWWRGFQAGYRYTFFQRQPTAAGQLVLERQWISLKMSYLQIRDLPETLSRLLLHPRPGLAEHPLTPKSLIQSPHPQPPRLTPCWLERL
jgi:hypothetical protein